MKIWANKQLLKWKFGKKTFGQMNIWEEEHLGKWTFGKMDIWEN